MPQGEEHKEVHFHYVKADGYRLVHATGAQGGTTPAGLIKFDLFSEFGIAAETEVFSLDSAGKLGKKVGGSSTEGIHVNREFQVGVVMSPKEAKQLGEWLITKAKEAKSLIEATEEAAAEKE